MNKKNDFLEKLASLIEGYDIKISYTTDDDGLHIYMGGENFIGDEIFIGYIDGKDSAKKIRAAKDV